MHRTLIIVVLAILLLGSGAAQARTATHVGHLALVAHRLWTRSISPNADSNPAYAPHIGLRNGKTRALLFVVAGNNGDNCNPSNPVPRATTYALDAGTGAVIWSRATSGPSRCTTAGPVVSGRWVYSPGLDGKLHRYNTSSGAETVGHGWPVIITLMPDIEKTAATPTIKNGYLYITTSGFIGDAGHYQGHLVTINLSTGKSQVFNSLCSNIRRLLAASSSKKNYCASEKSGLFGRGQGVVDPITHDVYVVSGNGPWNGHTNWGDTVMKLDPSGSKLLDAFTPTNQKQLESTDADLGSTGPAILPTVHVGGHAYHLLVQGGKGAACDSCSGVAIRLLNRDNLSGKGGPGHLGGDLNDTQSPCGNEVLTAPAMWKSPQGAIWVYYANDCGLAGYRLTGSSLKTFALARSWNVGTGGTTPVVHSGVVYVARGGHVAGYSTAQHNQVLDISGIGDIHWEYPLVTGNRLFISDQSGSVSAFSIGAR